MKNAAGCLHSRNSPAIWGAAKRLLALQVKAPGYQLSQRVLCKHCGHLPAARSDYAVLERLGESLRWGSGWRRERRPEYARDGTRGPRPAHTVGGGRARKEWSHAVQKTNAIH